MSKKFLSVIIILAVLAQIGFDVYLLTKRVVVGGLVHNTQEIFSAGLKAGTSETAVINSSGQWTGPINTSSYSTSSGGMTGSGTNTFSGTTNITAPLTISSTTVVTAAGTLTIRTPITATSTLTVSGGTTLNGSLSANAPVTIASTTVVNAAAGSVTVKSALQPWCLGIYLDSSTSTLYYAHASTTVSGTELVVVATTTKPGTCP